MFTYDQLYCFCEVYRLKSITAAAENLHVSRQAISLMINKMEHEYSITFFSRDNNRLYPTPLADTFYLHALEILNQYQKLAALISPVSSSETEKQTVVIGIPIFFMSSFGEELMHHLSNSHPNLNFEFVSVEKISDSIFDEISLLIGFATSITYERFPNSSPVKFRKIRTIPMSIWCNKNKFSHKPYSSLPYEEALRLKYCACNQFYNSAMALKALQLSHPDNKPNLPFVQTVYNFISQKDYVALDFSIQPQIPFMYEKFFQDYSNLILLPTEMSMDLTILYLPEKLPNVTPSILDSILEILG